MSSQSSDVAYTRGKCNIADAFGIYNTDGTLAGHACAHCEYEYIGPNSTIGINSHLRFYKENRVCSTSFRAIAKRAARRVHISLLFLFSRFLNFLSPSLATYQRDGKGSQEADEKSVLTIDMEGEEEESVERGQKRKRDNTATDPQKRPRGPAAIEASLVASPAGPTPASTKNPLIITVPRRLPWPEFISLCAPERLVPFFAQWPPEQELDLMEIVTRIMDPAYIVIDPKVPPAPTKAVHRSQIIGASVTFAQVPPLVLRLVACHRALVSFGPLLSKTRDVTVHFGATVRVELLAQVREFTDAVNGWDMTDTGLHPSLEKWERVDNTMDKITKTRLSVVRTRLVEAWVMFCATSTVWIQCIDTIQKIRAVSDELPDLFKPIVKDCLLTLKEDENTPTEAEPVICRTCPNKCPDGLVKCVTCIAKAGLQQEEELKNAVTAWDAELSAANAMTFLMGHKKLIPLIMDLVQGARTA